MKTYRFAIQLPKNKIGLTAWYTIAEIGNVKREILSHNGRYSIINAEFKNQ